MSYSTLNKKFVQKDLKNIHKIQSNLYYIKFCKSTFRLETLEIHKKINNNKKIMKKFLAIFLYHTHL